MHIGWPTGCIVPHACEGMLWEGIISNINITTINGVFCVQEAVVRVCRASSVRGARADESIHRVQWWIKTGLGLRLRFYVLICFLDTCTCVGYAIMFTRMGAITTYCELLPAPFLHRCNRYSAQKCRSAPEAAGHCARFVAVTFSGTLEAKE